MNCTIDRIVDGTAVLEGYEGGRLVVACGLLPEGAKEGSFVKVETVGDETVISLFEDLERKERIAQKMKRVWRK